MHHVRAHSIILQRYDKLSNQQYVCAHKTIFKYIYYDISIVYKTKNMLLNI